MEVAIDPCTSVGQRWLLVIILASFATYNFTTTPALAASAAISLSPPSGEVGDTVTVTGSGFTPFAEVSILFDEDYEITTPDIVYANEQGEYTAKFDVPISAFAGSKRVEAIDDSANATSSSSEFTVINTAPVADPQPSISIAENSSKVIYLSASDVNADILVFSITEGPSHGNLSDFEDESGELVYSPEADYNGVDSFSFVANDGSQDSNVAAVSIQVVGGNGSNSAPVAEAQSVDTDEDTSVEIDLQAIDADGDHLVFAVVEQPNHGTLSGSAPNLVFTPSANYAGLDSFIFSVNDGNANNTAFGTVNITIASQNDLPVARSMSVKVEENSYKSITLSGFDADSDSLSYLLISEPTHGTLTGSPPNLSYRPLDAYTGHDAFMFVARDWIADGEVATVSITVFSADDEDTQDDDADYSYDNTYGGGDFAYENNPPSANSQSISGTEDVPFNVSLSASDPENDYFNFEIIDYPLHGNLSGFDAENGTVTYTPALEYAGPDTFTFTANDDYGQSDRATVSVFIANVNDPPQAIDQYLTTYGNVIDITLTGFDPDGDYVRYTIISEPTNGTLSGTPPYLQYWITNPGFNDEDRFTFSVNDHQVDSNVGVVWINAARTSNSSIDIGDNEGTSGDIDGSYSEHNISSSGGSVQNNNTGINDNEITPGSDLTSVKILVDKSNVLILLSWEHGSQDQGVESTVNLQFSDRRNRLPLGSHVWYDLVIFDNDNKEIQALRDLVALNSVDAQKISFPTNGIYHLEVNVKGVIDKSTNSFTQDSAYTGMAFGTVVVSEFNSAWLMITAAGILSSVILAIRSVNNSNRYR